MINGLENFKIHFKGFENQYVIIGGTACFLAMQENELPFRATKDIDMVLIVESLTVEFGKVFWDFIEKGEYRHINKSTNHNQFYRFTSPKSKDYPFMIEIFSKNPEYIALKKDSFIIPLPIAEEVSSLSAILLNESYYNFLKESRTILNGISVLTYTSLIPFKAKAWLDLKTRKDNGESIDSRDIKKHKNDVFRLSQMITPETSIKINDEISEDLKEFLSCMEKEEVDIKSLGINGIDKNKLIKILYRCYGIDV